eukprot:TRINITY_DN3580_c0_g1_i1.p1 TRINITY_DN3580_c0_g1~~TRINITY_DN3580_c0_g1_i1.p1  ORF type:complete len:1008 (+),score=463.42 TRINITY_DN3580_c0_g1_i1:73-3096(+)
MLRLPSSARVAVSRLVASLATAAPAPSSTTQLSESFLSGTSTVYVEEMYESWRADPTSVHKSWDIFFRQTDAGAPAGHAHAVPPSIVPTANIVSSGFSASASTSTSAFASADAFRCVSESLKLFMLVRAFQIRGHFIAKVDPLEMQQIKVPSDLTLEHYGFSEKDLDREIILGDDIELLSGFLTGNQKTVKLGEIYNRLKEVYCQTIGVEYMHIQDKTKCDWIRNKFETPKPFSFDKETRLNILDRLTWADSFEGFLATKHETTKRFGLEGCEVLIPGIKAMIDHAAELGVSDVVIGMAHRGRLNVLANVLRKPLQAIFNEFAGTAPADDSFSGDVKYHLGTSCDRPTRSGQTVHLSLAPNPSHLEAVNPVVEGKVRAKQYFMGDTDGTRALPLLIHGDAAFAGQGVVGETLDLSGLNNYKTGGTIHIVTNNQIGFTTDPKDSRSSPYCTDVAKTISAPIFHVNGNDIEAVVHVMRLAAEYRQTFREDVVIDIICYRKYGHNEIDPPDFTQPLMYKKIRQMKSSLQLYREKILKEGLLTKEEVQNITDSVMNELNTQFEASKTYVPTKSEWADGDWSKMLSSFKLRNELSQIANTGIPRATIEKIGRALTSYPEGFNIHKKLTPILVQKKKMFESGKGFDWATAEALAFGSLLLEGTHVRLSGQDVERGTFSHRHSVFHDQETNTKYMPLNNIVEGQESCMISNSSLSEFAVLGFELGYSMENPNSLVLWEAQFGDFANGAQIMIDNFIAVGEQKWQRQSGLVMLLPHGYDGQGSEHSSARLERFLQMSDTNPNIIPEMDPKKRTQLQLTNWQVVNVTTPANYYHLLRRQVHRKFRKPLIVMSPKALLRHRLAVSSVEEFDDSNPESRFKRVIGESFSEEINAPEKIDRLVFCSGKLYYELLEARRKAAVKNVALIRLEQISPFPWDKVQAELSTYPNAKIIWSQEEPMNQGAWSFVYFYLKTVSGSRADSITYAGRTPSASPATGSFKVHLAQQQRLINETLGLDA